MTEKKQKILDDLYPFCERIFSDDFDFEDADKDFLRDRFYYRNTMLNIFNPNKFLILSSKGTGKTLFYKALQYEETIDNFKAMARRSGTYFFVNIIRKADNYQHFFPIDKFEKKQVGGNQNLFFHRFWIIYLWKGILSESDRLNLSLHTKPHLNHFVKSMNPNDSEIASDFVQLIQDDNLFGAIEQDIKSWDKQLYESDQYLFAVYDFLDEIVKPDLWETSGYGIVPLFEFWRYNPYKRILPKLFVRTDLFRKIVGITHYGSMERGHSFNLEWTKEELFALLFKQVLAKSGQRFSELMKESGFSSEFISETESLAEKNRNQLPLREEYLRPLVRIFFGENVGYHRNGGDIYTWFYINLRNANNTISVRPFLNMMCLAIDKVREDPYLMQSCREILPYRCYADADVRSECVDAYFKDLAYNSIGNRPLADIFDFIKDENKLPPELRYHTLTRSELSHLLTLVLDDKESRYLEGLTVRKLEDLMIDNGIIRKTYKRGGSVLYNFAYLYKFYLGLKSRRL